MTLVDDAFAAALYTDGDAGLDTAASLLAAAPAADAELARRGEEFLRRAWERGWQPADVVRLVRRDLADHHVRLLAALITAETGRYAGLPPRWDAQLAELPAPEWRTDRFSYATAVLELYRLLIRLPSIEAVAPPPGEVFAVPDGIEPRMLARIRALLAKAEATTFPEEAEALTAKAQELMSRHSVDELPASPDRPGAPSARRIGVDAPYETAKAILLDAVAAANRCRAVWNSAFGFSTVVGFEADLEAVELLHTSLLVQGTTAMTRAEAGQRASGRKRTKTFRQSFLMAYAARLGERLSAAAESVPVAPDLLPVLAGRDIAVTSRADEMFPRTTSARVRGVSDEAGWVQGRAAADGARVSGERRAVRRGS
ncbi:DUF2786 domain-containing protein [Streptomyces sp. CAU 1734]|uniref:DUF2786 domain-containing protein n=1 Tax=Streptomyces sp. CAU 1734 TaxID=3140360 RepID=UPI0032600641